MQIIKSSLLIILLYYLSAVVAKSPSFRIAATITIIAAKDREILRSLILSYVNDIVVRENGTVGYEVWETVNPRIFAFRELFTNEAAFNKHRNTQERSQYWPPLATLVGEVEVLQYESEEEESWPKLTKQVWSKPGFKFGGGDKKKRARIYSP